jgi:hypothetical protein
VELGGVLRRSEPLRILPLTPEETSSFPNQFVTEDKTLACALREKGIDCLSIDTDPRSSNEELSVWVSGCLSEWVCRVRGRVW